MQKGIRHRMLPVVRCLFVRTGTASLNDGSCSMTSEVKKTTRAGGSHGCRDHRCAIGIWEPMRWVAGRRTAARWRFFLAIVSTIGTPKLPPMSAIV